MNKSWRNVVIGDDESKSSVNSASNKSTITTTTSNTSNTSSSSPALSLTSSENDKKRHERLLIVYAPLVGNRVTVFLYDGAVFEGTLNSFETGGNEFALILRMATMMRPGREVIDPSIKAGVTFELMNIRFDDMAELKAASNGCNNGGIGTDAAISKKKGDFGKERELHRWTPEEGSEGSLSLLNENGNSSSWDQFATNEKLFGLKTDFNEEIYTTKLDRNSAHVRANEAKAERIAKEIMSGSTGGNVHLAEERGLKSEIGCEDEELLYGAVVRESQSGTLPPGFTQNEVKKTEAKLNDPNTADATTTTTTTKASTLNPSAPEFKLNVNAPEFKPANPAKVTYYNQPRRNLNYHYSGNVNGNGNGNGYYPAGGYTSVPYYYVPPVVPVVSMPPPPQVANSTSSTPSAMNPNAADFVMPSESYYVPPQYHQSQQNHQAYYYGYQQQGYQGHYNNPNNHYNNHNNSHNNYSHNNNNNNQNHN